MEVSQFEIVGPLREAARSGNFLLTKIVKLY